MAPHKYIKPIKGTRRIKLDLTASRMERERILREELTSKSRSEMMQESQKAGLERLLKFKSAYPTFKDGRGKSRKFKDVEHMKSIIEGYFESCFAPMYDKYGDPRLDRDGNVRFYQCKPFTISGLCLALGFEPRQLSVYIQRSLSGEDNPAYADVLISAKSRIMEFAESHLYDKDASNGAKFVLQAGFKWTTAKEDSEIRANDGKLELMRKEYELKKQLIDEDSDEDTTVTFNIVRATPKDGD